MGPAEFVMAAGVAVVVVALEYEELTNAGPFVALVVLAIVVVDEIVEDPEEELVDAAEETPAD